MGIPMTGSVVERSRRIDTTVCRSTRSLEPFEAAWNRLAEDAPQRLPTLSWAWVTSFLDHRLRPGQRWITVLAHRGPRLVGVLPLLIDPHPGPWVTLRSPHDPHLISGDPLVEEGEPAVLDALVDAAWRAVPNAVRMVLGPLPQGSPSLAWAADRGPERLAMTEPEGTGAYLPADEPDFDAFRATLSRNMRGNLNKAANKLRCLPDVRFRFQDGREAPSDMLERFMAVEASGWKGDAGTAVGCSPSLVAFYRTLTERLARAGWLEWQTLEADGELLAANLAIRFGRRMAIWKLAYRGDRPRLSAGSLLLERLVRRMYEERGFDAIDLMTDHAWYDNWRMQRRPLYSTGLYTWQPHSLVAGFAPQWLRATARGVPAVRRATHWLRQTRLGTQAAS